MRVTLYPGLDFCVDHVSYSSFAQTGTSLPRRSCTLLRTADGKAELLSADAWRPQADGPSMQAPILYIVIAWHRDFTQPDTIVRCAPRKLEAGVRRTW